MKGNRTSRTIGFWLMLSLLLPAWALAQPGGQSLYLLRASPSGKYRSKTPVTLYRLDPTGSVSLRDTLSTETADYILSDLDDGLIVVTYPAFDPLHVAAIRFGDSVESATKGIDPSLSRSIAETRLLSYRGGASPTLAFMLFDASHGYAPFSIAKASELPTLPQNGNCSYHVGGTFGVAETWSDSIQVTVRDNSLYPVAPALAEVPCALAIEPPPGLVSDPDNPHFLTVNSRRVAVVTLSDFETPGAGLLGYRLDAILDKSSGQWRQVHIPGTLSRPRSFGDWIAYVVLDSRTNHADNVRPATEMVTQESARAKVALDDSGWFIPGELYLFNAATGAHFAVQTGQSDSEPLSVSASTLYFRVNSSLYAVQLGSSESVGLADARLIAVSPTLGDVHWAFLSY